LEFLLTQAKYKIVSDCSLYLLIGQLPACHGMLGEAEQIIEILLKGFAFIRKKTS
jgi:hypothetical protein